MKKQTFSCNRRMNHKRRVLKAKNLTSIALGIASVLLIFGLSYIVARGVVGVPREKIVTQEVLSESAEVVLSPTPTSSPSPSPTPTPTSTPVPIILPSSAPSGNVAGQATDNPQQNQGGGYVEPSEYNGEPMAGPSERKTLLQITDTFPSNWEVKENTGVTLEPGKVGQGLHVSKGGKLSLLGENFAASGTLTFWMKIVPGGELGEVPLIDWNFGGDSNVLSLFEVSYAGDLYFSIYDLTENQVDISTSAEAITDWHNIKITWDVTQKPYLRELFVDGVKKAEGGVPIAPTPINPSLFQIGGGLGGRESAEFYIDELTLTNWVEREEEVVDGE